MCLPEPIADPLAGIDLPAGCQRLNGRNALGYVRMVRSAGMAATAEANKRMSDPMRKAIADVKRLREEAEAKKEAEVRSLLALLVQKYR
jgi:anionic cell wall polymer biosynthesis LytR-Cps2A-Psr (LCP) family protein